MFYKYVHFKCITNLLIIFVKCQQCHMSTMSKMSAGVPAPTDKKCTQELFLQQGGFQVRGMSTHIKVFIDIKVFISINLKIIWWERKYFRPICQIGAFHTESARYQISNNQTAAANNKINSFTLHILNFQYTIILYTISWKCDISDFK